LSDINNPRGKLSKDEFYTACKLVAVRQNGGDIAIHSCGISTPLPKLGGGGAKPAAPAEAPAPAQVEATGGDSEVPAYASALGLTASDVARYDELWVESGSAGGFLPAGGAVKFLGSSGLPTPELGKIWGLSDKDVPKGKLSKPEFYVACKLVAVRQNGGDIALAGCGGTTPLPKLGANPEGTPAAVAETPAPKAEESGAEAAPVVAVSAHAKKLGLSSSDVQRYDALWEEAETTKGFLPAGQAVKFLGTSGLPQADLGKIWGLSDYQAPKGALSKDEFYVACKLVALKQAGGEISFGGVGNATPLPKLGTNQGAEAAPKAAESAPDALPDIAKKLSLSQSDYDAYAAFWASVDKTDGFFPAGQAVKFLGSSGLAQADLGKIWGLSDFKAPKGKLSEDEFFVACKLVALRQAGKEASMGALTGATALPTFN